MKDNHTSSERSDICNQLNNGNLNILLTTTKCGGIGLNLTSSDTIIFIELSESPGVDQQAMDRCHRIGQKNIVNIFRIINIGTIEEEILKKQKFKYDIFNRLINQNDSNLITNI